MDENPWTYRIMAEELINEDRYEEPANPDHPLIEAWAANEEWIDNRLLLTPHSAFFTPESVYDMRYKGGEVAVTYLGGGRLQNCVNNEWLDECR